ncbi:MAG: hypothetical protein O3B01_15755 [Planctomycetota bacterium]|nr:hypothetical protein [Planctomycetota bacterium]
MFINRPQSLLLILSISLIGLCSTNAEDTLVITATPELTTYEGSATALVTLAARISPSMEEIPGDWYVTWTINGIAEPGGKDKQTTTFTPGSSGLISVSLVAYDKQQTEYQANKQYEVVDVQFQEPMPADIPNVDEQGSYTGAYSALGSPPGGDYLWSKVSGPGTVTIEPDVSANPVANYSLEGTYEIKVKYTYSEGQGITSTTSSPRSSARNGSALSGGSSTQTFIVLGGFKAQEAAGVDEKAKKSKEKKSDPFEVGKGGTGGTAGGGTGAGAGTGGNDQGSLAIFDPVRRAGLPSSIPFCNPGVTYGSGAEPIAQLPITIGATNPDKTITFTIQDAGGGQAVFVESSGKALTKKLSELGNSLQIKGVAQTTANADGRIVIEARDANGTLVAKSPNGFAVCAHPTKTLFKVDEVYDPKKTSVNTLNGIYHYTWGVKYAISFSSDSGTPSDLSKIFVIERVHIIKKPDQGSFFIENATHKYQESFADTSGLTDTLGLKIRLSGNDTLPPKEKMIEMIEDNNGYSSTLFIEQFVRFGCDRCKIVHDDTKPDGSALLLKSGYSLQFKLEKRDDKSYLSIRREGRFASNSAAEPGDLDNSGKADQQGWIEILIKN